MKYYAVQKGRIPGIYTSWPECEKQVKGFAGAVYKSFNNEIDAFNFIQSNGYEPNNKSKTKTVNSNNDIDLSKYNCPVFFVDGSYNNDTKEYSYGIAVIPDTNNLSNEIHINGKNNNPDYISHRNVAGEILASELAISYAIKHHYPEIVIFYDYEGIKKWCTGEWYTNTDLTRLYKDFYKRVSNKIKVNFVHVKGHSNNYYNDLVDALAKSALGIPLEKPKFVDIIHPIKI